MSKTSKRRNENTAAVEANWPATWDARDRIEATDRRMCVGPELERGDNVQHLATGLHKDCGASDGVTFSGPGSEEGAGHG